ncbi:FIST C-terminal domain-containing protein [Chitinimonas sp.]|uniref:FIST C-terminal domain-containing protein n=1 Tax=Chitinimonas sp. TaxID=1934313 RepID=UPI0035AF244F
MSQPPPHLRAATGLATAGRASASLAAQAVEAALEQLGQGRAGNILLFLSSDFAGNPQPAIIAAARAGQTLSVSGCTALGVMTEQDWLLDVPSACALVLADEPPYPPDTAQLSLAAPNAIDLAWLDDPQPRYGGIAGDVSGMGPYKIWRQSRIVGEGRCDLVMPAPSQIAISRALVPVSAMHQVTDIRGFDLHALDGRGAAATLLRAAEPLPPLHELALATYGSDDQIVQCAPLVSINPDGGVTVAARLLPGQKVRWMRHAASAADSEMHGLAKQAAPAFALVFSCAARGAMLHQGVDREWQALRQAWPDTPFAGFYGNGQIAPVGGANQLLHRSVVVAGFG